MEQSAKQGSGLVGDVFSAYLPYVPLFIQEEPKIKIVLLQRPCGQVVQSFMAKTPHTNHWQAHTGLQESHEWQSSPFDLAFPKYNTSLTKQQAVEKYCDMYLEQGSRLLESYPDNIRKET